MAHNYTCDRCGKTIPGYSDIYNQIKITERVFEHGNTPYDHEYVKDLCDKCIGGLMHYIENPEIEKIK